jgi:hypothetical protein
VLGVGGVDAVGAREVEPPDDADALGHVLVHARDLVVAGGGTSVAWKPRRARPPGAAVGQPLGGRHQPGGLQRVQLGRLLGCAHQPRHAGGLEHDAQVVELVERRSRSA